MANRRAQKRYVGYYGVDRNQEISGLHNGCNFCFLIGLSYPSISCTYLVSWGYIFFKWGLSYFLVGSLHVKLLGLFYFTCYHAKSMFGDYDMLLLSLLFSSHQTVKWKFAVWLINEKFMSVGACVKNRDPRTSPTKNRLTVSAIQRLFCLTGMLRHGILT